MKIADVVVNVDRSHEYLVFDPKNELIVIYDQEVVEQHGLQKFKRVFKILDNENCEELNLDDMVKEVVNAICSKIKMRDFLKNVMAQIHPAEFLKAYEILHEFPEAAKDVKSRDGCIYLDIPDPRPGRDNAQIYLRY